MDAILVLITTASKKEAEEIGQALVTMRLAACANIILGVDSIFFWKGAVSREQETLILLKTQRTLFEPLANAVKKMHSYSVPEIIALPIIEGSAEYLQWIKENSAVHGTPADGVTLRAATEIS
ncbi:MAG: divalent-cation tolerance protein CutA [Nitrospirota bacterium]